MGLVNSNLNLSASRAVSPSAPATSNDGNTATAEFAGATVSYVMGDRLMREPY